jgi:DNA invertase Pin-like site-specific DNA recombinase
VRDRAKTGDTVVVFDAIHLARSTSQLLEILQVVAQNGVELHFVKYHRVFSGRSTCLTSDLLSLMKDIESDFVSRRTTDALARRRAQGLPLGRPKGRKNKSLKLDKFHDEIIRYLELNISKASIAKLVRCHPQTLYDWLERKGIFDSKGNIHEKHLRMVAEKELVE